MIAIVGNIVAVLFLIWLTATMLRSRDPLWKIVGTIIALGMAVVVAGALYVICKLVSEH